MAAINTTCLHWILDKISYGENELPNDVTEALSKASGVPARKIEKIFQDFVDEGGPMIPQVVTSREPL